MTKYSLAVLGLDLPWNRTGAEELRITAERLRSRYAQNFVRLQTCCCLPFASIAERASGHLTNLS